MYHIIFTVLLVIIFGAIAFAPKFLYGMRDSKEDTPTGDDVYPEQLPINLEPHLYDNPNLALDELVRLSEEMGLYDDMIDKEDDSEMIAKSYFEKYPFAIEYNEAGQPLHYYVKGQLVTKEGFQWAHWCYNR